MSGSVVPKVRIRNGTYEIAVAPDVTLKWFFRKQEDGVVRFHFAIVAPPCLKAFRGDRYRH